MQGVVCILALAYVTYYLLTLIQSGTIRALVTALGIGMALAIALLYAGHGVVLK